MIYAGFNEIEIRTISDLLSSLNIDYAILSNETAIDEANRKMRDDSLNIGPNSRSTLLGDNCFYSIEINQSQLKALSQADLLKLSHLRIHPEITDVPDFDVEARRKPAETSKMDIVVGIMVGFILLVFLVTILREIL